ncbi:MAG: indolepyruvate ferredoxin oxidoreductase [Desulfovibrio sp.]|nr:indolepyruvate ferredoxin oxidoreductase [Desulfovibrio sp.]
MTATRLLTEAALIIGLEAISGEIQGKDAESSSLAIGGWSSPKFERGEADIILGFEPLKTLRALPLLCAGGAVFCSLDPVAPKAKPRDEDCPDLMRVMAKIHKEADYAHFISCEAMGKQAGAEESGATALLGALCASGLIPIPLKGLERAITKVFSGKEAEIHLCAMRLGAKSVPYPVKNL